MAEQLKNNISLALKYRPQTFDEIVEQDTIKQILKEELRTNQLKRCLLFTGGAGTGKCLGKDTPVLMYDKTIKLVQDIEENELLMGPDTTPRRVISTAQGRELMYKVTLEDGSSFICNKSHILTLKYFYQGLILHANVESVFKHYEQNYKYEYFAIKYNDNHLYNFEIEKLSEDDYYGFSIEPVGPCESSFKNCFVLGNGIVTHNTTSARIFAREIDPNASNIIEINCADHTGVDDVRNLILEPSRVKPLIGTSKIFILDEVHMLTVQSQNALLKLLEEPPAFCIYILCTTDPQKILSTILSRVFRYDFQLITQQGIVNRLDYILKNEGYSLVN